MHKAREQHDEPTTIPNKNPHDALLEDIEEEENVDVKIENLGNFKNTLSTIAIKKITMERDDWEDRYEVEARTIEALQELLKSLDKDYQQIVQESDKKTQHMKNEKHEVHKRWYQSQKATEVDKIEISNLKRKINEFNKKKSAKTQKYDMLEKENKSLCQKLTEKPMNRREKRKNGYIVSKSLRR